MGIAATCNAQQNSPKQTNSTFQFRILDPQNASYKEALDQLTAEFGTSTLVVQNDLDKKSDAKDVLVTLGIVSLKKALNQKGDYTIVALLATSEQIREQRAAIQNSGKKVIAIYSDPDPMNQLRLITAIFPSHIGVAVFLSPAAYDRRQAIKTAAGDLRLDIDFYKVDDEDSLFKLLARSTQKKVILALPDAQIYNPQTVRNFILTSYRNNQAIIGYSQSLVKAGGLASVSSNLNDIFADLSDTLLKLNSGINVPSHYSRYFTIVVNHDVANSLNIVVDPAISKLAIQPTSRAR